ncbi:MAG: hypothetical protein CMH90_05205 [Oceanicaulis sp.]|uniref:DUF262 domain-containing protein n=1 Tax=Oceanicaulis sp. UBA2681 TaxID=1947007 RepID=UPI000C0B949E|nr:DUF262 domain-containing protein [Oceanicaulis sp. UBA2681]MAP48862.1 hypothetical protein [Oceanicaulis sp.]
MNLQERIAERRKEIRTDGYPISIGEWISLYQNGELDIHPEFQRFFRWSDTQKTSLIESILLGIPIPSIFVSQREDGVWDVIDGLQRLSTIFQFVGVLADEHGERLKPLALHATKYIPELEGVEWSPESKNPLPADARLIFKRSKINSSIILRESDETAKYDLFQRLNTGGSQASDQEVRNCILVMINTEMFRWMKQLADYEAFRECIAISDRLELEAYDLELILRFIIFSQIDESNLNYIGDVGVFLTERMREIAESKEFDFKLAEHSFKETFDLLLRELADSSFKRYNVEKGRFQGGFAISQFESVACGIGFNVSQGRIPTEITEKVAALWSNEDYTKWTGSGITAARRLPRIIPIGREVFSS